MSLLSMSPLLSTLFVSYANRAAAATAPPPDSEERKALEATIAALQEENEKLKSENRGVAEKLKAVTASQESFRSQVSHLKEVNAAQQYDIKSLRVELSEAKEKHERLLADSNTQNAALQVQISGLEVGSESSPAVDQTRLLTRVVWAGTTGRVGDRR